MGVLIFLKGGIIFASVDSMSSLAREAGDQRPTGKFSEGSLEKGPRCPLDLKYSCTKTDSEALIYHDSFSAVVYLLDARSIARLGRCCKHLNRLTNDKHVVAWLSAPRAVGLKGLTCVQHLRIFELVSAAVHSFEYDWGMTELKECNVINLQQMASILRQHPKLNIRIEGHCGIEAPTTIAIPFSKERAKSVATLLIGMIGDPARVSYEGFGNSRPVVKSYGPFDEDAIKNRRTEVYLYDETGAEFPVREPLPNFTAEEIRKCREDGEKQRSSLHRRIEDFANFCYVNDMENVLTRIREVRAARNTLVDGTAVFLRFIYPVLDAFQNGSREESKLLKLIDDLAEVFYRESGLGSPV